MNLIEITVFLIINFSNFDTITSVLEFKYHDHTSLTQILFNYSIMYPNKTYLYSIGKSVEGYILS